MFFLLERANCEEDTDKYLAHILNYCKKDYIQSDKKRNGIALTIDEIKYKNDNQRRND